MASHKIITLVIAGLLIVLGFLSLFTTNEGENAFILRLGKIVSQDGKPEVLLPGLHAKIPFIDQIRIFDTRIQQLSTPVSQPLIVISKEQTYLVVDYFAKWRITDLVKFYTSTGGSVAAAETLLEQKINDIVRAEYGKRTSDQAISSDRENMMATINKGCLVIGKDQGIQVMDVRIQQVTLPKDVMDSVFERMAAERKQFAEAKRAEGKEKAIEVKALADQKVTVVNAQAVMQAAAIRAKGDQQAADMYAKAYSVDKQFYAFYRSLEAYTNSFNRKRDILILKPEGQFFNYFHKAS